MGVGEEKCCKAGERGEEGGSNTSHQNKVVCFVHRL